MDFPASKLKKVVFLAIFEMLTILAIFSGIIDRNASFVLLLGILTVISFLSVEEATSLVVISIPLFIALPFSQNTDNFASWRFVIIWLFLMWFLKNKIYLYFFNATRIRQALKQILLFEWIAVILFVLSVFSLLAADNLGFGLRKIIFLANIVLLYLVVRSVCAKKENRNLIFLSIIISGLIAVIIAVVQFIAVQFVPLLTFWKYWVEWVIPIFYGTNLAVLLDKSNTWFSYYPDSPPTLRLFSVFPDSHSFGLFALISACAALIIYQLNMNKYKLFYIILWAIFSLHIYLSGTRGLWLAVLPIILGLTVVFLFTNKFLNERRKLLAIFSLYFSVIFFLLYWVLDKLALSVAFGACNRIPFLCSDPAIKAYEFPYSLWVPVSAILISFIATVISFFVIYKGKIFSEYLLPRIMFVPLLFFIFLLPVSSFIISRAHGQGVSVDKEMLLLNRASSILDLSETSNRARIDIWRLSLKSISEHPLLGVGIGNYAKVLDEKIDAAKRGASAHNLYLDFASETGIAGGVLVFGFFGVIIFYSYKLLQKGGERDRILAVIFGIYFVWIMLYNFFDVVLINDKVLLLFSALLGTFSSLFIAGTKTKT